MAKTKQPTPSFGGGSFGGGIILPKPNTILSVKKPKPGGKA